VGAGGVGGGGVTILSVRDNGLTKTLK